MDKNIWFEITEFSPPSGCEHCEKLATKRLTWRGFARGDHALAPKRRKGYGGSGIPTRAFEASVVLCEQCENARASIDLLEKKTHLPGQWAIMPLTALSVAVSLYYILYRVLFSILSSFLNGTIAVLFTILALFCVSPYILAYTFTAAHFVAGKVDASFRRKQKREYEEARKIVEFVNSTAEGLVTAGRSAAENELFKEQQTRLTNLKNLQALGGHKFEELMTRLFSHMGYDAQRTRGSGDGGIDIVAERRGEKVLIQCKNHKHPLGPASIRDLYGVMMASGAKRGIVVCTSTFSEGAKAFAKGKGIDFIDGDEVINLISRYGLHKTTSG